MPIAFENDFNSLNNILIFTKKNITFEFKIKNQNSWDMRIFLANPI